MPIISLNSKFINLIQLMRLDSPTGYLLAFFPSSFGLMLAYEELSDLIFLLIFFLGSILMRSSGCIINDLLDQNLDKRVERTKDRPIASGKISNLEALILLFILLSISLVILLSLTKTAIYIGIIAVILTSLYPLMKRFTYFPQLFLGITFNTGCLIGYATIKDTISYDAIIIYIACGFWTVAYDTIYAFMDLKDDKIVGIKSTAIFFENQAFRMIIASFYFIFLIVFIYAIFNIISLYSMIFIIIIIFYILWITIYLDINDTNNCSKRFKANNHIGFLLFMIMLLEKL